MRIIRYLKHAKAAVVLIVLLLVVQAFTDLSLPRYTSEIVDIGIQQSGVENVSPEEMRESTYLLTTLILGAEDKELVEASYESQERDAGTVHVLTEEGRRQRVALDEVLEIPFVVSYHLSLSDKVDVEEMLTTFTDDETELILGMIHQAKSSLAAMDEGNVRQQALLGTRAEYEALDFDLGGLQMAYLFRVGLTMAALAALGMAASIAISYIASRTGARIGHMLRGRLFKQVVSFSDAEVQGFSAASLITRGTNDIQQIQMVTTMLLRMLLYSPILAIGGVFMISQTNLQMGWIILLAVAVLSVVVVIMFLIVMPKFKIVQQLIDKVNLVSRELLSGVQVVRVFDRQSHEEERFDGANTALMKVQLFTNRAMSAMMPLMSILMNGISVLIVWVGASYIDGGIIQTGDLIAFISYAMLIIMSFLMIAMMAIMLPRADVAAHRVNEVLAKQTSVADPPSGKERDGEIDTSKEATLAFDRVSFTYADSKRAVLEDISFTARPGETTAIVGSTGSGKSTVVKLIERFYDVSSGSISLDGIDIRELTQNKLHSDLGYVPQKAFLFSGTIESNIAYGGKVDEEETARALSIAQVKDFVDKKEDGLASEVSQGGTNVSGGQRQRLSIARALASDARVFVFDDSFSALDYKTDAALRRALKTQLAGKTLIIVAQRISTVMDAEQIVVLDEGRLVGKGTHQELLKSCEEYYEIASSQLTPEELAGGDRHGR